MNEYTLTEDTARRLLKAIAWVERQQIQGPGGEVGRDTEVPNGQHILVDDPLVSHTTGGFTYNAAKVQLYDAELAEFQECGECWLVEVNGRVLVAGEYYMAIQSGNYNPSSAGERVVFVTGQPCCP